MSSTVDDDDTVLSDVEGEDPVPTIIKIPDQENLSADRIQELLSQLEQERKSRESLESTKSELQVSFNRLKVLTREAIKMRDESSRQRDEALCEKEKVLKLNEKLSVELSEAVKLKSEASYQLDEVAKLKESLRSEVETSAHMLVTGIEKVSSKVTRFKNFSASGFPKSQKYTGLPAVSYGVVKRTNEIVEELVKQIDITAKSRDDTREQMEQKNYEIAIEISQLEATISHLREGVLEKSSAVENLEKSIVENDLKMSILENKMTEKLNFSENETLELRQLVDEFRRKLESSDLKMKSLRPLLTDHLDFVSKIHERMYHVIKIIDAHKMVQSELSESLFLPQETDLDENVRASLAGMESIYELLGIVMDKTEDLVEEKGREANSLNETVAQLVKEKQHIRSLLRSALSKQMTLDPSSKGNELFQVAENGLRTNGIEFCVNSIVGDGKLLDLPGKFGSLDTDEDDIYTLATTFENIVKASHVEIIELQHVVDELRAESSLLKEHVEAQSKELSRRKYRIEELVEKEKSANDSVEGLMMDIASAEEEITRWKVAAEEEAAAGRAVEQEFLARMLTLHQDLEDSKQTVIQSDKKLKFKEETACAAMTARDAAEKSLRLADLRSSRLRDRVEELSRQIDMSEDGKNRIGSSRYMCWPWQWLGLDFAGVNQTDTREQQGSNEMELSEPLL